MDNSRRKFLEKAGKLAVYTPPAMVALSYPSLKAIAKSGCNDGIEKNGKIFLDNDDHGGIPGAPQNRSGPHNLQIKNSRFSNFRRFIHQLFS